MKIRKFQKKDTNEVALLAMKTFKKYNSSDYFKKEGIKKTLDAFNPNENLHLSEDFKKTPIFYVAEEKNKIVGMIRGTTNKLTSL